MIHYKDMCTVQWEKYEANSTDLHIVSGEVKAAISGFKDRFGFNAVDA
jgi:hypothetical protein